MYIANPKATTKKKKKKLKTEYNWHAKKEEKMELFKILN